MASQTKITITHDKESTVDMQTQVITTHFTTDSHIAGLKKLLGALGGSIRNGIISTVVDDGNGVAATGTLTLASVVATNTCVVSGTTFTAVASGATGPQFNVGANDTATAANLVAAINGTAAFSGALVASSSAAVVTITSAMAGTVGNAITLAGGTNITAAGLSNGRLSGGSVPTNPLSASYSVGL